METTTTTRYEIVTAVGAGEFYGTASGNWDTDPVGLDNDFATIEDAERALDELEAMGDDWAGIYSIREIGQRYPESNTYRTIGDAQAD